MDTGEHIRGLPPASTNGEVRVVAEDGAIAIHLERTARKPRPRWSQWMPLIVLFAMIITVLALFGGAMHIARSVGEWNAPAIWVAVAAVVCGLASIFVVVEFAARTFTLERKDSFVIRDDHLVINCWKLPCGDVQSVRLIYRNAATSDGMHTPCRRWRHEPDPKLELVTPHGTIHLLEFWTGESIEYAGRVLAALLSKPIEEIDHRAASKRGLIHPTVGQMGFGRKEWRWWMGFVSTLLIASSWMVYSTLNDARTADWPKVQGAVFDARPPGDGKEMSIEYVYVVDGERYRSSRLCASGNGNDSIMLMHLADTARVGTPVNVYYNPSDPKDACLDPGASPFMIGVAALMPILSAWLLWWSWRGRPTAATDAMIARYYIRPPAKEPVRPARSATSTNLRIVWWRAGLLAFVTSIATGVIAHEVIQNKWRAGNRMGFQSEEEITSLTRNATLAATGFSTFYLLVGLLEARARRKREKS